MDIREKFKLIRKQRKISLRELGNIAGSASSISDFENGKTNLSNDILFQLLGYMIVEINEIFDWSDFHSAEFLTLKKRMDEAMENSDWPSLLQIKNDLQELAISKHQYIYHILSLVLEIIIAEKQHKTVSQQVINELTDYFFSLDYWTNLDIGLMGSVVSYFTTEAIVLFTDTILENTPDKLKNNLDRIKIDTILNLVSVLISRKEKSASKQLLTLLFEKHFPNYFAFQKLYLLELKAIYQSIWEDPKQGRSLHNDVIHSVSLLLSKAEAQEWDAYFLELTEQ